MEMRQNVVRLLSNSRYLVDLKQEELAEEERELIMNLSPVFLEWEEKTRRLGEQRGIEIGEQRGEQRGKEEVARKMLAAGLDLAQICQFTGLSREQIQQLTSEES